MSARRSSRMIIALELGLGFALSLGVAAACSRGGSSGGVGAGQQVGNPECPVDFKPTKAEFTIQYQQQGGQDRLVSFCSRECLEKFQKNPGEYYRRVHPPIGPPAGK